MHKNNSSNKRKKFTITVVILLVIAVGIVAAVYYKTSLLRHTPKDTISKTTSKAPTAQAKFTDGDQRVATSQPVNKGEATVSDNNGSISNVTNKSDWTTSSDGAITAYTPAKNSVLINGAALNGSASVPKVSFRLIDNISGVIADGELNVANGKFSGTFNFSTAADQGRVDIFSTKSDGTEIHNLEIPIRFK